MYFLRVLTPEPRGVCSFPGQNAVQLIAATLPPPFHLPQGAGLKPFAIWAAGLSKAQSQNGQSKRSQHSVGLPYECSRQRERHTAQSELVHVLIELPTIVPQVLALSDVSRGKPCAVQDSDTAVGETECLCESAPLTRSMCSIEN